jgi:hypothetical protein
MKDSIKKMAGILGVFCLFVLISFSVWIYFRGSQPMELPEARGITFWQFIRERWGAWRAADQSVSAEPQYAGCGNNILSLFLVNLRSACNFVSASLAPQSRLAAAFRYWEEQRPDAVMPRLDAIQWPQAPDAFWNYFSRAYWRGLVTTDSLADQCRLGPVNFNAILGAAQ